MTSITAWLKLLRCTQWSKNAVVFAALVFGAPAIENPVTRSVAAFLLFCCVSSAIYILNDYVDIERDRQHPTKQFRPLAAGLISTRWALAAAALLALVALVGSWLVTPWLMIVIATYAGLMVAYTYRLKNIVLVDAFTIGAGFVLRAVAGAAALQVPVSAWLMLCTMLLALFLAFGKRRSEILRLREAASTHREVLAGYNVAVLDAYLVITATCAILGYSIYSVSSISVPDNGSMMFSVPFVIFAMMRYLHLVMNQGEGGTPETLLWQDKPLLTCVVCWGIAVILVMHLG